MVDLHVDLAIDSAISSRLLWRSVTLFWQSCVE